MIGAIVVEVDLRFFYLPGTVFVREQTVLFERYFTIRGLPPAVLILVNALRVEIDLGIFALPPAVFILIDAVLLEGHFAVRSLPPSILVLVNALCLEVDSAVLDSPPAIHVFVYTAVGSVDPAIGVIPPVAVWIRLIGKSGELVSRLDRRRLDGNWLDRSDSRLVDLECDPIFMTVIRSRACHDRSDLQSDVRSLCILRIDRNKTNEVPASVTQILFRGCEHQAHTVSRFGAGSVGIELEVFRDVFVILLLDDAICMLIAVIDVELRRIIISGGIYCPDKVVSISGFR